MGRFRYLVFLLSLCGPPAQWILNAQQIEAKIPASANSDPNYRAIRDDAPWESRRVDNVQLQRDVAAITLKTGQITFLSPIQGRVVMAVFSGEGQLQLKPDSPIERNYLLKLTGQSEVQETFDSAAFVFTDKTYEEIQRQSETMPLAAASTGILRDFRRRMRREAESRSNLDAEILAELYTPASSGSFRAFVHGKRDADLRFLMVPSGAIPYLPASEEVALVDADSGADREGVWYLAHFEDEVKRGVASSNEDHRAAVAKHYQIETTISNSAQLSAKATIQFASNVDGLRAVPLGLLPALRVAKVTDGSDRELAFIQEPAKEDAAFYVLLPEPLPRGQTYELRVEYQGTKVVTGEGRGNFSVGAREEWYPSLNSFQDRATYDLTFRVPNQYTVVSVGKLVKEWPDHNLACSQWISDVPLAVAGFNYGAFKKKQVTDSQADYQIEVYANPEVPDYLHGTDFRLTTMAMADKTLVDAQNAMRLFEHWFGNAPYGRIAITQQPQFNFGQSWPSLVYLPISAFLDPTTRYLLMQQISNRFSSFIQEVTPHEISHQWWGHMVGWASFHDQWLSEGFAEFSAGLFIEAAKPAEREMFWKRLRDEITEKNEFGNSPNDAGPIWLGLRLNTSKNPNAYNQLVYPKGAYTLQMLRMLMRDDKTGDQDFIAMMQDYVSTNLNRNASSEDFKSVVEKHMRPALDLEGNKRIDWFYRDWVYGSELPKYQLDYSFKPGDGGKVTFQGKITQSNVSPDFRMRVPIYFDFDGRWIKVGTIGLLGNTTTSDITIGLPKKPKRVSINANQDVLAADVIVKEK